MLSALGIFLEHSEALSRQRHLILVERCSWVEVSVGDLQDPTDGGTVPYKAIFCEDIPLHSPHIDLILIW